MEEICVFAEESLYILHIVAADAFPCAVVEEEDIVAIDAGNLVAVLVHGIPPFALFDAKTAVSEHLRNLIGIGFQFASRTMVDVPRCPSSRKSVVLSHNQTDSTIFLCRRCR